uniref:Calcineurin-like phosphoesterase domain-containing protein n=1 Tax=Palpitomonas bilix TaxID=652834 RepID=A0A7S3GHF2_9EUKA
MRRSLGYVGRGLTSQLKRASWRQSCATSDALRAAPVRGLLADVWEGLKEEVQVREVAPYSPSTPRRDGHLRVVCISDTHSMHWNLEVPDGDVLLFGGDFSACGVPFETVDFNRFLESLPHKHKIVIAGNHDVTMYPPLYNRHYKRFQHIMKYDTDEVRSKLTAGHYLEETEVVIEGIKFFGSPWQPEFAGWAFNLKRGEEAREHWARIPDDVDVLLTHGPPLGIGDCCYHGGRVGCEDLLKRVREVKPRVHVFGHIHEGYGTYTDGDTFYINASNCRLNYVPVRPPIVFDLPLDRSLPPVTGAITGNDVQVCRVREQASLLHIAANQGRIPHLLSHV